VVPPHYDSLIAKLIVRGTDRTDAIDRTLAALRGFRIEGVPTTIPMHLAVLDSAAFRSGAYDTRAIPGWA
jgi:acetyl-CoA carboxylase biotin carboxylase subunit